MAKNIVNLDDKKRDYTDEDLKPNKSLYGRLKKLFSNDVIVRNVGGKRLKVIDTDNIFQATDKNSLRDRFDRIRSTGTYHSRDMNMSYQATRLELFRDYDCVSGDTIIPLPSGENPTIKELVGKYQNKKFEVWSYDHDTDSLKVGIAFNPRSKGIQKTWKVIFNTNEFIISTEDHLFLLKDGQYKPLNQLKVGHALMSFSQINHTIQEIVYNDEIEVFDISVEKFHNFCTDSVIIHNCMDMDPIISAALDIYSDESTCPNEMHQILTIRSENDDIQKILENLFFDILNLEFNLWSWIRNLTKYGDFFLRLDISPEYGIHGVVPISAYEMTRVENSDPNNPSYVKFQHDGMMGSGEYENFEIAHFRLISDANFLPYGKSMIESGRRVWKQLSLLEDSMLIHRIMRAPERRIFKIDIGAIPPAEIDAYMNKITEKIKKVPYIDERSGDYNLRFNLQNMTEDFYLPVRGGDSGTAIDTLPGMEFTGIDDIEYIRNKMMAALKMPKAFLGYADELGGRATLSSMDVRFARTINRIQKIVVSELSKIAVIHLYSQGFKDASLVNFELRLTNASTILEQEKIAILSDKISLAKDMMESRLFSKKWIYRNIFDISNADADDLHKELISDTKDAFRFAQIESEGNDPAVSGQKLDGGNGSSESTSLFGSSGGSGGSNFSIDEPDDEGGEDGDSGQDTNGGEAPEGETHDTETESEPDTDAHLTEEHNSLLDPDEEREQREKDAEVKRRKLVGRGGVEDPLGKIERNRDWGSKSNPLYSKPRLQELSHFKHELEILKRKLTPQKQSNMSKLNPSILLEDSNVPLTSMLDEANIINIK